ncbi:MAG: glycosyl hydrolase, partial [Hyphomicrobiaceae bacterium]
HGVDFDEQLSLVADLGLTSYRVDVPSILKANALETLIDKGRKLGIDILPILIPPGDLDKDTPEGLYKKANNFATFFVTRFAHKVKVWELGNELENYAILQPCEYMDDGRQYDCASGPASGVSPLEYEGKRWRKVSSVLKGLSDATIAAAPHALKAMGTAGWGHVGAFERMRDDGIKWDISVWHNYDGKFEWGLKRVAKFGKPIWITEFNNDRGSQNGDVVQAEGLARSITEIRRLRNAYNVRAAHIYELLDETYWAPDYEGYMGLAYLDKGAGKSWRVGGPKPAYCSVRTMLRGGYRIGLGSATTPGNSGARRDLAATDATDMLTPVRSCNLCTFAARDVPLETAISYSYCLSLGHPHDGGGLEAWSRDVRQGKVKLASIRRSMLDLKLETIKAATLNDSAFVTYVRRLLLDAEPVSIEHWSLVHALQQRRLTREQVIDRIFASSRFRWMHPTLFNVKETIAGSQ